MVLKYLRHSTGIEDIRQDLLEQGHVSRNIVNARHKITKEPLNLFFIDLEPAKNNKAIYVGHLESKERLRIQRIV